MRILRTMLLMSAIAGPAWAVQPDEILKDPALEARARELSAELRCLVCQNQSIDDSDAPLARDLRLLVRERIAAGETNAQVKTFLVERYGAFVLLKPPVTMGTLLLWAAPVIILLAALIGLVRLRRRTVAPAGQTGLTAAEAAQLAERLRRSQP